MTNETLDTIRSMALLAATLGPVFTAGVLYEKLRRLGQDFAEHGRSDEERHARIDTVLGRHSTVLGYIRGHLGIHNEEQ